MGTSYPLLTKALEKIENKEGEVWHAQHPRYNDRHPSSNLFLSFQKVFLLFGEQNLKKYHEESKKVSKVSVSLIAVCFVFLQVVNFQSDVFQADYPFLKNQRFQEV